LFAVVALVGLMVGGVIVGIVYFAIEGIKNAKPEQINSDLRFILPVQLFSYAVMLVTMFVMVRFRYGQPFWRAIQWSWSQIKAWVFVAAGIGLALLSQLSEIFLKMPKDLPIQKVFSTTTGAYLMGILGVFIAPIVEELFFRGFLYPVTARRLHSAGATSLALAGTCGVVATLSSSARSHMFVLAVVLLVFGLALMKGDSVATSDPGLRVRLQMLAGIIVTTVAFALIHAAQLGYSWTPLLVMCIVGGSLTTIRAVTRSVAASTIAHMTYNFVLMAALWIATDHFRHMEQITK
jgi:membrane protease YdiL (CAAX protease family)